MVSSSLIVLILTNKINGQIHYLLTLFSITSFVIAAWCISKIYFNGSNSCKILIFIQWQPKKMSPNCFLARTHNFWYEIVWNYIRISASYRKSSLIFTRNLKFTIIILSANRSLNSATVIPSNNSFDDGISFVNCSITVKTAMLWNCSIPVEKFLLIQFPK